MPLTTVSVRLRNDRRHALEPFIAEFINAAAYGAEQMLVVRNAACRFEAPEAFAEVALNHETALHQQIECAIDGRGASVFALRRNVIRHFLNREMPVRCKDDTGDRQTLLRDGQIVLPQKGAELRQIVARLHADTRLAVCYAAGATALGVSSDASVS